MGFCYLLEVGIIGFVCGYCDGGFVNRLIVGVVFCFYFEYICCYFSEVLGGEGVFCKCGNFSVFLKYVVVGNSNVVSGFGLG